MSLQFSWDELWSYHDALADAALKTHLQEEIIGEGWLYRQPAKTQKLILAQAPPEFIQSIVSELKPEVAIELGFNPYIKRS